MVGKAAIFLYPEGLADTVTVTNYKNLKNAPIKSELWIEEAKEMATKQGKSV